jgi:hypothetical protein
MMRVVLQKKLCHGVRDFANSGVPETAMGELDRLRQDRQALHLPPEDCQNIKLPRIHGAFEQVQTEACLLVSTIFNQSLHTSCLFFRGQVERLRPIWRVGKEDEPVRGNDNGNDTIEHEDPAPIRHISRAPLCRSSGIYHAAKPLLPFMPAIMADCI